jgi:hypothetical protein
METFQGAKSETPNRIPTISSRQGKFAPDFHGVKKTCQASKSLIPPVINKIAIAKEFPSIRYN